MKRVFKMFALMLFCATLQLGAFADTYYVSPSGSDNSAGTRSGRAS